MRYQSGDPHAPVSAGLTLSLRSKRRRLKGLRVPMSRFSNNTKQAPHAATKMPASPITYAQLICPLRALVPW